MHHFFTQLHALGWWNTALFAVVSAGAGAVAAGVLAAWRLGRAADRRHAIARTVLDGATVASIALVLTMTLLPLHSWNGWEQLGGGSLDRANFVPLRTIDLYLSWGTPAQLAHNLRDNVLLFVPLGWCLALRWRTSRPVLFGAIAGALLSVAVEAGQFVLPIGRSTDVDDVLLNTAGAIVGATLAAIVLPVLRWVAHRRGPAGGRATA